MNFEALVPPNIKETVKLWIEEDLPLLDVGGYVVGDKEEIGHLLCKSSCTMAGRPWAQATYDYFGLEVEWKHADGDVFECTEQQKKHIVAIVKGPCRKILMAERVSLNVLSRASGVATATAVAVAIKNRENWNGEVAGTRKTTPGLRAVEKYSLIVGGGSTHRNDLSQMVMLKDNHIWSCGDITKAVTKAKSAAGFSMKVEVECQSVEEAWTAAAAGAEVVMLDNFDPKDIGNAALKVKEKYPNVIVEASGGITQDTMHLFMDSNVDVISRGNLTQGYPCIDFSLKIQR